MSNTDQVVGNKEKGRMEGFLVCNVSLPTRGPWGEVHEY